MTAAEKKAEKKAANIAAYKARCERLAAQQKAANIARKAGFVGTDTQVIAAYEEQQLRNTIQAHLENPQYGKKLGRFLAGREYVQPPVKVMSHIQRFLKAA